MTERIQSLLAILKSESYKENRATLPVTDRPQWASLSPMMQEAHIFRAVLDTEIPYFHPGERIGFNRYNDSTYLVTNADGTVGPAWRAGNLTPDYEKPLQLGVDAIRADIAEKLHICREDQQEFYQAALMTVDSALEFADRTASAALVSGNLELYGALQQVPRKGARTLLEACIFLKFIIFTLRCNRNIHITLGRFDKYMRPYYQADRKAGKTREELLETLEEFFLSINFDTDLYHGIQKGDNGQSLVLGGCGSFDDFSHMCMEASMELNLIDPKINLRVDKNTPDELYEFATLMTKQGLGFPQYCNDDVVIPGLIRLGYAPEDAADYAVAACWEFIIPGKGFDVPNLLTMNFPKVVNDVVHTQLLNCSTFQALQDAVKDGIANECGRLTESDTRKGWSPSPYLSVYVSNCLERGADISQGGAVYNNYGCHGAGIATAADSLTAIKEVIYETQQYSKQQLLDALNNDFEGWDQLRNRLLACPKMGNNDPKADAQGYFLMDAFSENIHGKPNDVGGVYRAGTGSAHEYYYSARNVGATADGRKAHQFYGCSYSPSLEAKINGPLSCIHSFTGYDLTKVINGGPLTLEIHDTVFRNQEGIKKVAQLVKAFVMLGGHQLQLNSLNREILEDATVHPERHKNLIVRVWGWSGYFVELEEPFRQHIIKRTEHRL